MAAISEFEVEFVERTKLILKRYRGEFKLSNAINCTLGLLVLPNENIQEYGGTIWEKELSDIIELDFLKIYTFEPIQAVRNGNFEYYRQTLKVFLKKVRNGFAHQNITPVNQGQIFTGLILRNHFTDQERTLDLEVEFSREDLEKFAIFIADKYLETPR